MGTDAHPGGSRRPGGAAEGSRGPGRVDARGEVTGRRTGLDRKRWPESTPETRDDDQVGLGSRNRPQRLPSAAVRDRKFPEPCSVLAGGTQLTPWGLGSKVEFVCYFAQLTCLLASSERQVLLTEEVRGVRFGHAERSWAAPRERHSAAPREVSPCPVPAESPQMQLLRRQGHAIARGAGALTRVMSAPSWSPHSKGKGRRREERNEAQSRTVCSASAHAPGSSGPCSLI
ncbi:PREDICTED: uncharacterized protein LOC106146569 [Chinchilla lanigera]|uniref:uncharacterized protein LOC106146569 n=1 Tax=Chinchilla lanigera TaxID=34839 RepID=UPI000695A657|nr:PREDICTED: uncharacterized protein LOC106146569 [Chinchilla lanigera]